MSVSLVHDLKNKVVCASGYNTYVSIRQGANTVQNKSTLPVGERVGLGGWVGRGRWVGRGALPQ